MRKTKKAASRRMRMNKSGKIKRARPGKGHLLTGKSRSRKRALGKSVWMPPMDVKRMRSLLPHG